MTWPLAGAVTAPVAAQTSLEDLNCNCYRPSECCVIWHVDYCFKQIPSSAGEGGILAGPVIDISILKIGYIPCRNLHRDVQISRDTEIALINTINS